MEVIDYIKSVFTYTTQCRTVNYIGDKAAIQRAGTALKMKPDEVDRVSASADTIDQMKGPLELKALAKKFLGYIQNFGVHASAIIVVPDEFENWFSIEQNKGNFSTSFAYHEEGKKLIEDMGILKLDILGLGNLDVIDKCTSYLPNKEEVLKQIYSLPDIDYKTFEMLRKGDTSGCFQIESPGMTSCLLEMKPTELNDLINLVAAYRPGVKDAGMLDVYLQNRNGKEFKYDHPLLKSILSSTYNVILYQEQILKIAKDLCGYTLGEGDMLRRAIGRKVKEVIDELAEEMIKRGVSNGIEKETMKHIAEQVIASARYLFNLSHATAYGYVAYQTAYLKAHYPREYMCALLNVNLDNRENTHKYVNECKKMGIRVLNPNIYTAENEWKIDSDMLVVGFSAIKNVGGLDIKYRTDDLRYFIEQNSHIDKSQVEALVKAGTFTGGGNISNLSILSSIKDAENRRKECLFMLNKNMKCEKNSSIKSWNIKLGQALDKKNEIVKQYFTELSSKSPENEYRQRVYERQMEVLGFTTYGVYTPVYDDSICQKYPFIKCGEVFATKRTKTKKGKPMMFVEVRVNNDDNILKCVYFEDKEIIVGTSYMFKMDGTMIKDFMPAVIKEFKREDL